MATPAGSHPPRLIDTDVHEATKSYLDIVPYLEPQWRKYIIEGGWVPPKFPGGFTQPTVGGLYRADARPADGAPAGSDYELLRRQLLEECNVEFAVLTGWLDPNVMGTPWVEFKSALASAVNKWTASNWLEKDDRLVGSIHVCAYDTEAAVREIEQWADHPRMVQVILYDGGRYMEGHPGMFGHPMFHPIFEACERHNLVLAVHHSENSPVCGDFMRYYIEWHTLVPQVFQAQVTSLIFNGVPDKYPRLKFAMIEGGFTWAPWLMWKLDQQYRQLRLEVPWVKRLPSRIVQEQFRFATQPIERLTLKQFMDLIDHMGSDELLMFSTDYPHWDFDAPLDSFPAGIPEDLLTKLMSVNARDTYTRLQKLPKPKATAVTAPRT